MTLDQIELEENGFHEALNPFIISKTMESVGKLKRRDAAIVCLQVHYMKGKYTVKSKCCVTTHCWNTLLCFAVNHVLMTLTVLLYLNI